jgi:hypothetical protein
MPPKKRRKVSTPPRKPPGTSAEAEVASPTKSPDKKKVFKGNVDMEEEGKNIFTDSDVSEASKQAAERERHRAARELQKKTGRKSKSGSKKSPIDIDDESTVFGGESEGGGAQKLISKLPKTVMNRRLRRKASPPRRIRVVVEDVV